MIRAPRDAAVADTLRFAQKVPGRLALCLYPTPSAEDIEELAEAWQLHPLLVEDLQHAGQRPKLERYGNVLFLVVRSARYLDDVEDVEFAEFHVLVRANAVAVLCQDGRWIDGADESSLAETIEEDSDRTLRDDENLFALGPEAVVYRLLDPVVDGYRPVLNGLAIDKEQIEKQVFSGDPAVTERIYRLSQEVIDLSQATSPLVDVLGALRRGHVRYEIPEPLQSYLQDVADHLTTVDTQVSGLRDALTQILTVNATLVAQRQNEDMKKISGWAAILFAPTLVAAIYGMNFDDMPELHWGFGYPAAVVAMVAFAAVLYWTFKHKKWM
ncbi:magnesium and cobalt transport protein CorA [Rhodococcus sp. T7]|uniref:magnesium and cobalt transport protein CorA n=1 Tax=Rhodococcus sp. T7 TaxID=627444 RepID=UPI0013CDD99A|nr:magnesium and cobalt transport protein CorA [Rhodococcus sp. T7]KAF0957175.1 Cobalt/magnesium transport protein CorA [Rhodococcus sp. T7]KAF0959013.1 Cobalt/magnesium transport protein CorA [Rhodococcus sp. T7]